MNLNFDNVYSEIVLYLQNNVYVAVALAGVFLLLLFKKPKLFFIILLIICINIASFYVISEISIVGTDHGSKLAERNTGQIPQQ